MSEAAGQPRRRRPDFSVDPHPGDRNVMDLNRQVDEEMASDSLQEQVAEALEKAVITGLEDYAVISKDHRRINGTVSWENAAASLIASLGLELEWWIYYDDPGNGRGLYSGPHQSQQESETVADEWRRVLRRSSSPIKLSVKPRIVAGDVQEETGE